MCRIIELGDSVKRLKLLISGILILAIFCGLSFNFLVSGRYEVYGSPNLTRWSYSEINGTPMVMIRRVCDSIGCEIKWYKESKTIVCTKGLVKIEFRINDDSYLLNGEEEYMDAPVALKNSKAFIPLSFPWEKLNAKVKYNKIRKMVEIEKGSIVFFGDSITEGFKIKRYFSYPNLINEGVSANKTTDALKRVNDVIDAKPDMVFIMLGTNDAWAGMDPTDTLINYDSIITEITDACPYTTIVIQSVLPLGSEAFKRNSRVSNKDVDAINAKISIYAYTNKFKYVNLNALYKDPEGLLGKKYSQDGVHLVSSAYKVWAKRIKSLVPAE